MALTTRDRVGRDEFALTQQYLSQIRGVRRPTVFQSARKLQAQGLIRYRRGTITLSDRRGAECLTCSCYGIVRTEFDRMTS